MARVDTSLILGAADPSLSPDIPEIMRKARLAAHEAEMLPIQRRQAEAQVGMLERRADQDELEAGRQKALKTLGLTVDYAKQVKALPMAQRRTFLNTIPRETIQELGIDPEKIQGFAIDDASIDTLIAQSEPLLKELSQGEAIGSRRSESLAGGRITVQEMDDGTVRYLEYGQEIPANEVRDRVSSAQQDFVTEQRKLSEGRRGGALTAELDVKPQIASAVVTAAIIRTSLDRLSRLY